MVITEEQLKQTMEMYGNVRHQIELLKANKQTVIDSILAKYPEAKKEIEDAQEELDGQLKTAEISEVALKKILDVTVDNFVENTVIKDKLVVKTKLLTVSIKKGEVVYDSKILDGYVLNNPELLSARQEKPASTRVTLNKV